MLILSHDVPETSTAGGILLYRLFKDYPVDRVYVIGRSLAQGVHRLPFSYEVLPALGERFERSRFHRWERSLRALRIVPAASPFDVEPLLHGFIPDVVVTVMQSSRYYNCAYEFAQLRRLPLIGIVHDVNDDFESVYPWAKFAVHHNNKRFYRYCSARLCVSAEMELRCAKLYGVRGSVQYPNRTEDLTPRPPRESLHLKSEGRLTVGYVGNTSYGYGEELIRMLPILRRNGSRLIAFGPRPAHANAELLTAGDCCQFRGFLPASEAWNAVKRECDAVLLAYLNPPAHMERLYSHHFPSKLPEYLALGMPVIIAGPHCATGVKWGLKHPDTVVVCTEEGLGDFERAVQHLTRSPEYRITLSKRAVEVGNLEFNPVNIRLSFIECLIRSAQGQYTVPAIPSKD